MSSSSARAENPEWVRNWLVRLSTKKNQPRNGCCLFYIKPIDRMVGPVENVHYNPVTKLPITHICPHKPNTKHGEFYCSPRHEYFYFLIKLFANGDITRAQLKILMPVGRHERFEASEHHAQGILNHQPEYSSISCHGCAGFVCENTTSDYVVPEDDIRCYKATYSGLDWDPTTLNPYTTACSHSPCQDEAAGLYTLMKAYAAGILDCNDFSVDNGPGTVTLKWLEYIL